MIDRTMRLLLFLTALMPLWPTEARGEEPLPPRALARLGDHRFYHGPGITCVALSPDGQRAASAAREHDPNEITENGASLYDRLIVVWDTATGERLHELHVPHGTASRLTFSPEGKRLAASYAISENVSEEKSGVVLFNLETGKLIQQLSEFQAEICCLQFSTDGKQLRVSEWGGPVSAWDASTGKRLRLWKPPPSTKSSQEKAGTSAVEGTLSPDDRIIVWKMLGCSGGGCQSVWVDGLRFYNAETNKLLYQKQFRSADPESNHDEFVWSFAFTRDSKRLVADCGKLAIWEAATGKELFTFKLPGIARLALSQNGQRAVIEEVGTQGERSRLRLWNLETGKPVQELLSGFEDMENGWRRITPVFSADGKTLLLAAHSTLRLFDARTGQERAFAYHGAPVTPRFSADGRTLFTTCAEKRCRWNVAAKEPTLLRQQLRKVWEVDCLAHSNDGQLFVQRSDENGVCVRETATGRVLHTLPLYAHCAELSSDGRRLLLHFGYSTTNSNFQLYDVKMGQRTGEIKNVIHRGGPVFSPNGRLVAWADRAGKVHVLDAITGKDVRTLRPSRPLPKGNAIEPYLNLVFSPDGKQLIMEGCIEYSSESEPVKTVKLPFRVFEVSSGRQCACFDGASESSKATFLSCMACSPDGRLLAVAEKDSGMVRVLEIASGKTRIEFAGHHHGVHGLAFSPDGKTLASGGEDNVVFLWDITGAKTLAMQAEHDDKPTALWNDLASDDVKRAGCAISALLHEPDHTVAILQQQLHPAEGIDEKRLAQWIADLDAAVYATRVAANDELFRLGERAEAALRRTLTNRPSLEVRKRIDYLLQQIESGQLPSETLRTLRAIEVLEQIGTPAAQGCLAALAKGASGARTTREAKSSLHRLAERK